MIAKPSRLDRDVARYQRGQARKRETIQQRGHDAIRAYQIACAVRDRDGGHCRVCGAATMRSGDPRWLGHAHHIVFRSAGGASEMENLLHVCGICHSKIHAHQIHVSGSASSLWVSQPTADDGPDGVR